MNDVVKEFLSAMRAHHGFEEFKKYMEPPGFEIFKKSKEYSTDQYGARAIFSSGQITEWKRWYMVLTGKTSQIGEFDER